MKKFFITLTFFSFIILLIIAGCSQSGDVNLSPDVSFEPIETVAPDTTFEPIETITPDAIFEPIETVTPDASFEPIETVMPEVNENGEKLGYIYNFNEITGNFDFDEVEWILWSDTKRVEELEELGIDIKDDMPNGFYIYNPSSDMQNYNVSDATEYAIIDWHTVQQNTVSFEDFLSSYNSYSNAPPYQIAIDNDIVVYVREVYIP